MRTGGQKVQRKNNGSPEQRAAAEVVNSACFPALFEL